MEKEILVEVQNVSKKFTLDLKTSLKYGATDIIKSSLGFKTSKELRKGEFWAVKDISFKLRRGECIGLIGHNGAGKSTLLKVLNGLYAPDKGQIVMRGKVGALIELGAGFNPILTGRENIYNNAAILGFTKEEVNQKIQSIIDFSEIEKFIDMPVQNYSSGMKVRLGFAVAAHLEPDILIIDEVLAVGDLGFVIKCFSKIDELLPNTAIIFVSHSMNMISRICTEIILMNNSEAIYQGKDIGKGVQEYFNLFTVENSSKVYDNGYFKLIDKKINIPNTYLEKGVGFTIEFTFELLKDDVDNYPHLYLLIKNKEQIQVAGIFVSESKKIEKNIINYKLHISNQLLTLGKYNVDFGINDIDTNLPYLRINNIFEFLVSGSKESWVSIEFDSENILS
ncbi:ABC transporter ATP-binding protein [Empedobacter falsenii]|uniref:ABC transporter ATP-binding protein n=1 Tax=Empedobacter falsenii TaxID=343874 RepID=A0A3R8SMR6_9FLAO|nr:ABC transporter ATP-binding protein [Empedobacter falsenii]RRT92732.1 ABC transporter ATP-binding protein [Empedobacter falsenii]RRT92825.1 ABC transporter ATP-binding protein [Empedobacter falsenii]